MKKLIILQTFFLAFLVGCTLLDVETSKTETTTTAEKTGDYKNLESRIEVLEEKIRRLEQQQ